MGTLQSALDKIDEQRTNNGLHQKQAQAASDYLTQVSTQTTNLFGKTEEVNMAEAISNLRTQETTYQTVLEVSQRTISAMNLFDYLK